MARCWAVLFCCLSLWFPGAVAQAREQATGAAEPGRGELTLPVAPPVHRGPESAPLAGPEWQPIFEPSRESDDKPYWRRNLFKRFAMDQKPLLTTWFPSELRRPRLSVPLFATIAAGNLGGGESFDLRIERSLVSPVGGGGYNAARAFTRLGDPDVGVVLIGATYLLARWGKNDRLARASSLSAEALMNAAVYSTVLKKLTRRTRPASGGVGDFFVSQPLAGQETDSFPSGHAMGAMAVATVLAKEYDDKRWVGWRAYGTAGLIGASRVALGRHFPSDVIVGATLGHSLGRMVITRERGEEPGGMAGELEPLIDPANGGVGVAYHHSW